MSTVLQKLPAEGPIASVGSVPAFWGKPEWGDIVVALDPGIAVGSILTDDPIASVLGALSHTADLIVIGGRAWNIR